MQWSDIPFQPSPRTLRQFGFLCVIVFGALGGMNYFVWSRPGLAMALVVIGVPVGFLGLVKPRWVRWIYVGWIVCVFPIGWVISRLILALLFYGLFTPVGLLFRVMGRDALGRRESRQAESYWIAKQTPEDEASYFRQS